MSRYFRVTEGLADKGFLATVEEFNKNLESFESDDDQYASLYHYNEEHKQHFEAHKTIAGIKDVTTDVLIFDFDNAADPSLAQKDAVEVLKRIRDRHGLKDDNLEIYWSGAKGFSVCVKLDRHITPEQHSDVALKYFGYDLKTLDRSIYNASRLIRVPNSRHQTSKLFKVQLSPTQLEFFTIDQIREYATKARPIRRAKPAKLPDALFVVNKPQPKLVTVSKTSLKDVLESKPRHWKDYKWALVNAIGLTAGERHNAMMTIAATCRGYGYTQEITEGFLTQFDEKYSAFTQQDTNDSEITQTLNSVYGSHWNGGQYSYSNSPWLKEYCKRLGIEVDEKEDSPVITITDIKDSFTHFVNHLEENTIKTGIAPLDECLPITVGMNLGIIGAPASGKSSVALEILKNTSKAGVHSVFASLDMHRLRMFQKLMMKVGDLTSHEVIEKFRAGDTEELLSKVKEDYGNVWFYDRSAPTVDDIRRYILEVQERTGQKVKLVMLDYFERVNSERSDDTAASKEIAGKLQDLVNDLNVAMITLVQPNKFSISSGPDHPILNYTAIKGSSFLYQSFRSIISLWRPFCTPEWKNYDKFMQMAILKNDLGELNTFNFKWHGRRGEISELTDEGEEELKECLHEKETRKKLEEQSKKDGWN